MSKMSLYEGIKKNRAFLMGVAILGVLLFHSGMNFNSKLLNYIRDMGYGGVDIFMLVSGFGIAHSLQYNKRSIYLKNRFLKILPSFWLFWMVYFLWKRKLGTLFLPTEIIGNLSILGWWFGCANYFNWYIAAIAGFYLISPLIYDLFIEIKHKFMVLILMVSLSIIIAVSSIGTEYLVALSRFPVFILGMYFALKEERRIEKWKIFCFSSMALLAGNLFIAYLIRSYEPFIIWNYGLWWFPFIIMAPAIAGITSLLLEFLLHFRAGKMFHFIMEKCGKASFEIYLVHFLVNDIIFTYFSNVNNKQWMLIILLSIFVGIVYHFLIQKLILIVGKLCGFLTIRLNCDKAEEK